ncbi:MAG: TerB family tellurite resistance protein [Spirochaetia bacterium]|jgi:tellurite resistance protein|nr:TerB family tellurite resistance protein [Spirochaetia bacterium]
MENINLTGPEAGVALSTLVAFSDDNPSPEEVAVMRKYYKFEDVESFQKKVDAVGFKFPEDFPSLESIILETLKSQELDFKLRTLAVALVLAHSDGVFDQNEMNVLNRFCLGLELSLSEADLFSKNSLKEIDEVTGYSDFKNVDYLLTEFKIELSIEEAGAALSILVGLSDDDPSDEEAGVMREYFSVQVIQSLMSKVAATGNNYPEALVSTKKSIFTGLRRADRDIQKKYLAIAYKVAGADGLFDDSEIELIQEYCTEYGIGIAELKDYFKADIA